jgi:hypothetical protein
MVNTKRLLYSFAALLLVGGFWLTIAPFAYADSNNAPVVQTSNTPDGQAVTVTIPEGYSGKVVTTYDGHQFNTVTSPLTSQDIQALTTEMTQQQQYFNQLFADQQKMMNDIWSMQIPSW